MSTLVVEALPKTCKPETLERSHRFPFPLLMEKWANNVQKFEKKPALHPRSTKQPNKLRMVDNTMMLHARLASSGMAKIFSSSAAATERKFAPLLFGRPRYANEIVSKNWGTKPPAPLSSHAKAGGGRRQGGGGGGLPLFPLNLSFLLFLFFPLFFSAVASWRCHLSSPV